MPRSISELDAARRIVKELAHTAYEVRGPEHDITEALMLTQAFMASVIEHELNLIDFNNSQ